MNTSFFQKFVEQIPPFTKKYVERQGEFAVKLSELLESTGMTQRELAEKLGKKESYVSRILAGWSNPTLKTIVEFEVALGKDILDFNLDVKRDQSENTLRGAALRSAPFAQPGLARRSTDPVCMSPALTHQVATRLIQPKP